jgi:hypothetical protein
MIAAASHGESILRYGADPSMWQMREGAQGDNLAGEYRAAGVHLVKANNDRLSGLSYVREALAWEPPRGDRSGLRREPRLQIFEGCVNLIRTLPSLPYDNIRVEDVDTRSEDHAYDALRYGLALERQAVGNPRDLYGEVLPEVVRAEGLEGAA